MDIGPPTMKESCSVERSVTKEHIPLTLRAALDDIRTLDVVQELPPPASPQMTICNEAEGRDRDELCRSTKLVSLGHFDPDGVEELRRSLSRVSVCQKPEKDAMKGGISTTSTAYETEGFDFETELKKKINREAAENITTRTLGVMFKQLTVKATNSSSYDQPTLLSSISPMNVLQGLRDTRHPVTRDILSNFDGALRPGEMLLVLGRPGSGCSTFLKTLANQTAEYHAVTGLRHYDSLSPEEIERSYRGDVTYCPEDDIHFPTLTVKETLEFAAKTRVPHARVGNISREQYITSMTETLMTVFGLRHAANTPVGDASIRGVSGGEKKRVSICEALATRSKLGAWDNSTRGLDASTALEFVRALRIATDLAKLTTAVAIYQVADSLYELFDKVCVIYEGRMVYYGRAGEARAYFEGLGYIPANRQTIADFLVTVTDPNARIGNPEHPFPLPRTADDFVRAFQNSAQGHANRRDIEAYETDYVGKWDVAHAYKRSADADRANHSSPSSSYIISVPMQIRAVMTRRMQILKGDWAGQAFMTGSFVFQAIIFGTVFFQLSKSTSAYYSRGGILFFGIINGAIASMSEMALLYAQRPIIFRQMKAAMYHPFVEALAYTIVDAPLTIFTQTAFSLVLYFLVGLQHSVDQVIIFCVFIVLMTLSMKAFFLMLAAAFKKEAAAQGVSGVMVLLFGLYTGFTTPKSDMVGALRWLSYINPLRYGFEGILTNEFHTLSGTCSSLIPQGPGYENVSITNQVCTAVGSVSGKTTVDGNAYVGLTFDYHYHNLWRNLGILVAYGIGFVGLFLFFTEVNISFARVTVVTLFKRGSKPLTRGGDEENATPGDVACPAQGIDLHRVAANQPAMTDVFTWNHIEYNLALKSGEQRRLLHDVSGYVTPGKLTALMGESGAGKTTLLNVLAERYSMGVVTGDRYVNGQPPPSDFQAQTGYCQQTDTHTAEQTVREALLFSAKLRQPASVPLAEKEAYVESCLKMCGLEAYGDAIVGTLGVEFKKRTTIGVELAAKPKLLLFLDEPTSGLDSQSAWAILSVLRNLANNGQAILCTIHQPSGELFRFFDRLLLLRKGGQTVYFGDLGDDCGTLTEYFSRHGGRKCGPNENPAEWMLDVIGAGATAWSPIDWHAVWKRSNEAMQLQAEIDAIHAEGRSRPAIKAAFESTFATSWLYQFNTLVLRTAQCYWRNPPYLLSKIGLNVAAGLLIGFTFYHSKDTLQGVQNKLFAIFMGLVLAVPLSNQLQFLVIQARSIYEIRERPSRMYSWSALVAAHTIVELPWCIFGSALYFVAWYWTSGFATPAAGYSFLMVAVIFPIYFTTLALAVAVAVPNTMVAALLYSSLFSFADTFNGVLQPYKHLGWWKWMYHASPFTYLIDGLLSQAVGGHDINCSPTEFAIVQPPRGETCIQYMESFISFAGGYINNPDGKSDCQFCPARSTDELMAAQYNIFAAHRWRDIGILVAFITFNITATFAFMWFFRVRTWTISGALKRLFGQLPRRRTKD